eukprot:476566-Amphidinium_carterae.2
MTPSKSGLQATIDPGILHLTDDKCGRRGLTTDNMQLQEWYDDNEDYDKYELKGDQRRTRRFTKDGSFHKSTESGNTAQQLKDVIQTLGCAITTRRQAETTHQ